MANSVNGFIISALRKIGIVADGQNPPPTMVQRGLECLNDILDEWGESRILIPYQAVINLTLNANQEAYTIGNSGIYSLNANPIIDVLQANINDAASPGVDYPTMPPMTEAQYANIAYKTATGIPTEYLLRVYKDNSELRFQPLPYKTLTAKLLVKQRLSRVELTDDLTAIPYFYSRGLKYKLALDVAQQYARPLTPQFSSLADDAINKVMATAVKIDYSTKRDEQINRKNCVYFNWWI